MGPLVRLQTGEQTTHPIDLAIHTSGVVEALVSQDFRIATRTVTTCSTLSCEKLDIQLPHSTHDRPGVGGVGDGRTHPAVCSPCRRREHAIFGRGCSSLTTNKRLMCL